MSGPREPAPKITIAHVLSMDVVGYSLLLITDQTRVMNELTNIVKGTEQFRRSDGEGKLMRIPTGDGMSLVFFDDPQAPIECATEIAAALKDRPDIPLRMGIHSGPVNEVVDVSERSNVAGVGIDMAERVTSCGDAGHILLSKRIADDLAPFPRWHSHLHNLGEYEVKHGRKIALVNFYTGEVGNPTMPKRCANAEIPDVVSPPSGVRGRRVALIAAAVLLVIAIAAGVWWKNSGAAQGGAQSIVVLPFENASNDRNMEYLAEGISDALINSLTELRDLRVIARATAFQHKGKEVDPERIGRELRVKRGLERQSPAGPGRAQRSGRFDRRDERDTTLGTKPTIVKLSDRCDDQAGDCARSHRQTETPIIGRRQTPAPGARHHQTRPLTNLT